MLDFLKKIDPLIHVLFLVTIAALGIAFFTRRPEETRTVEERTIVQETSDGGVDEGRIREIVGEIVATLAAVPKTVIQKEASTQTRTSFIPFSGPITTTSTGWVDLKGTDVYIDLKNDFSEKAYVTWEAFLKVAHGNGQASARLFDVTHGTAVDGSEISTSAATSTQVVSPKLSLWSGRNLYRVQIKSLNTFEVTFDSGRMKVVY